MSSLIDLPYANEVQMKPTVITERFLKESVAWFFNASFYDYQLLNQLADLLNAHVYPEALLMRVYEKTVEVFSYSPSRVKDKCLAFSTALASQPCAPLDVLWKLSYQGEPSINAALCRNPSSPIELINSILTDDYTQEPDLFPAVAANACLSALQKHSAFTKVQSLGVIKIFLTDSAFSGALTQQAFLSLPAAFSSAELLAAFGFEDPVAWDLFKLLTKDRPFDEIGFLLNLTDLALKEA